MSNDLVDIQVTELDIVLLRRLVRNHLRYEKKRHERQKYERQTGERPPLPENGRDALAWKIQEIELLYQTLGGSQEEFEDPGFSASQIS